MNCHTALLHCINIYVLTPHLIIAALHYLIVALGVKEVWQVPESVFKKGYIQHTLGWPLQSKLVGQDTFGGSFLYHMEPNVRCDISWIELLYFIIL